MSIMLGCGMSVQCRIMNFVRNNHIYAMGRLDSYKPAGMMRLCNPPPTSANPM